MVDNENTNEKNEGVENGLVSTNDYHETYVKAVDHPLPPLKLAFKEENRLLRQYINQRVKNHEATSGDALLDMGCGVGRSIFPLAYDFGYMQFVGTDNNPVAIADAKKRLDDKKVELHYNFNNLSFGEMDALHMRLPNRFFITMSSYNTLGSLPRNSWNIFVEEQAAATQKGGYIINIGWNNKDWTTRFQENDHYPDTGLPLVYIDNYIVVAEKEKFHKITFNEMHELYKNAGIEMHEMRAVGDVWVAYVGRKQ